jgi:hypothetical protein
MKAYKENRVMTPLIVGLGTGWRLVINFRYWPLYSRKSNPVANELRGGGVIWENRISPCPILDSKNIKPVAIARS